MEHEVLYLSIFHVPFLTMLFQFVIILTTVVFYNR